jgi:hypothetical protein
MKHSVSFLFPAALMVSGVAGAKLELVMKPGMTITAETKTGIIAITAGPGLKRTYTWEGVSQTITLWPRTKRWYGSLGASYSSLGDDWPEHDGITRGVLDEGQQHFESERQALDWLQEESGVYPTVYRDDGLVVSFDKYPRRTMWVRVWQIFIHGEKPKELPGSTNDRISITQRKTR